MIRKISKKCQKQKDFLIIFKIAKMNQNEPKRAAMNQFSFLFHSFSMNQNEPKFNNNQFSFLFHSFSMNQNEPKIYIYRIEPK